MAEESFLTDDLLRQLISVGEVDLLVGIPSLNNVATIANAVAAAEDSFQHAFPRERAVIVNVDSGSNDGTPDAFLNASSHQNSRGRGLTSLRTGHRVVARCDTPSPAAVFRTIVATAELVRAKACAVVSPASPGLSAGWVENLLQPVCRQDFDFVAPLYARQRFDGLLVRQLLYPMSRAIFGRRIRELLATEFGFSGRLASNCANRDAWHEASIQDSPQTWMAATAISSDFRCCQSFLGPKVRPAAGPPTDLVTAIRQAVGALFWCAESQQRFWMQRTGSEPLSTFGPDHELTDEPANVNLERIFELFRCGVAELSPILKTLLNPDTNTEIQHLATLDERSLCFDNTLWARTLYDFAGSYHHALLNRDHLVQALVPLYRGRIYSFFLRHASSSPAEMEADSENLCLELERQKPYLIERWKKPSEVVI
ncbi:MAG: hypothetical protein ABSA57_01520 [Candidatus Acidiferrales bacterium]